jgi:hypothetical protein
MKWEYKIKEFTTWQRMDKGKDGMPHHVITFEDFKQVEKQGVFGKKKKIKRVEVTTDVMEATFNELGMQGWEMCGVIPLVFSPGIGPGSNTDRVYFVFKRQKQ